MPGSHKRFLAHAAVYGLGVFALQAASIVLLPLYTHYLTPAEFGVLEILNRLAEILNICLMAAGLRMATLTFYNQSKDDDERAKSVTATTFAAFLFLAIGSAVVLICPGYIGEAIEVDRPALVVFGTIAALLESLTVVPLCLLQARVQSVRYVCVTLAMFVVRVTLAIVTVAGLGMGIWGVFASSAIMSTSFGLVMTWREFARGGIRFDWRRFREVLRFSAPFVPGGVFMLILRNGDRFFLLETIGPAAVGIYALGCRLASVVTMFTIGPLYAVWGARMYATFELPNAPAIVGRVVTRILAAYIFVGIGVCVLNDEAIALLASPQYAGAAHIVGVMVLSLFFFGAANLMDAAFYVRHRTGVKPWITGAAMLVTLGLYAWLIPQNGPMGAAWATLIGNAFYAAATWAVSQRVFWVRYEFGRLTGMLTTAIALVVLAGPLDASLASVPFKLLAWGAWPVLLWVTGLITKDEKAMFFDTLAAAFRRLRKPLVSLPDESDAAVGASGEVR